MRNRTCRHSELADPFIRAEDFSYVGVQNVPPRYGPSFSLWNCHCGTTRSLPLPDRQVAS